MLRDGLNFKSKKKEIFLWVEFYIVIPKLHTLLGLRRTSSHAYYDHGQKSWDTCIGWGEGELQENFEKDALFYKGTQNDRKI